jgi:hypothetical protein
MKTSYYGRLCDTGALSIRARVQPKQMGAGLYDPSTIEMAVEIWTTVPFGPEQERGHCMEVDIPAPMNDSKYEDAYKRVVLTYEDYWKAWGAEPPKDWRDGLAVSCGTAMARYMSSESCLN